MTQVKTRLPQEFAHFAGQVVDTATHEVLIHGQKYPERRVSDQGKTLIRDIQNTAEEISQPVSIRYPGQIHDRADKLDGRLNVVVERDKNTSNWVISPDCYYG